MALQFIPVSQMYRRRHATCFGLLTKATSGLANNNTRTKLYFLLPVSNHVTCCEDPRGKGDSIVPKIIISSTGWKLIVSFTLRPFSAWKLDHALPASYTHSRSWMFRRRGKALSLTGVKHWFPDHPSRSRVTILTKLWIQIKASPSVSSTCD